MFPIQEEAWTVCSLPGHPGDILSFGEADSECLHTYECLHNGHHAAVCGNESVSTCLPGYARLFPTLCLKKHRYQTLAAGRYMAIDE